MQDRKSFIFDSLFQIDLIHFQVSILREYEFFLIEDIRRGCRTKSDIIYPDKFEN